MKKVYIFFIILFFSKNISAAEFEGNFIQGHFILGKTEVNTKVWIDKKEVKVSDDGFFVFGIGRDRKYDIVITLKKNGIKKKIVKKIQKRKYKIQRIDGLEETKVTPPEEVYERIKKENKLISNSRAIDSDLTFFTKKFIIPVEKVIITGVMAVKEF